MPSQPANQNFLFVNKDSSSQKLSRSGRQEQSRILSHVRQKYTTSKQPWREYTTVLQMTQEDNGDFTPVSRAVDISQVTSVKSANSNRHEAQARTGAPWLKTLKHNESVYAYLSNMWPSSIYISNASQLIRGALDAYSGTHLPTDFRADSFSPRASSHAECTEPSRVQGTQSPEWDEANSDKSDAAITEDLLLYSSIARGSSSSAWKQGRPRDDQAQLWVVRTLQTLRDQLARPATNSDAAVVLSVFTLALVAFWDAMPCMWRDNPYELDASQFETCRTHLRAIITLVEKAGGWHNYDPHILGGMLLVDKYTALHGLQPPLIPLTFDPDDSQLHIPASTVPIQDIIPNMATGFQHLRISPDLKQILHDVGRFHHAAAGIWKTEVNLTPQQEDLLYRRFQALHYKLLLLPDADTSSQLIRLTTLVVLCNATLYAAGLVFTRVMLCHLHERMTTVLSTRDQVVDDEIWYWCLCTGATTRLAAKDKIWFTDRFFEWTTTTRPGSAAGLPAIRGCMTKYLYIPWLQDTELGAVLGKSPTCERARGTREGGNSMDERD